MRDAHLAVLPLGFLPVPPLPAPPQRTIAAHFSRRAGFKMAGWVVLGQAPQRVQPYFFTIHDYFLLGSPQAACRAQFKKPACGGRGYGMLCGFANSPLPPALPLAVGAPKPSP